MNSEKNEMYAEKDEMNTENTEMISGRTEMYSESNGMNSRKTKMYSEKAEMNPGKSEMYYENGSPFYDERIENVKGQIAKKAIFIAMLISLVFGGLHIFNIQLNVPDTNYMWLAAVDITVFVSTAVTLIAGLILSKRSERDERAETEISTYYNKAATVLLNLTIGVYAFVIPIALNLDGNYYFYDNGAGDIIQRLLYILPLAVMIMFKHNNIYFNYTLMESGDYYKGVFHNIGKLAVRALIFLGISFISTAGVVYFKNIGADAALRTFIIPLLYTVSVCLGVILYYLVCSILERISYKCENGISLSPVLLSGGCVLSYIIAAVTIVIMYKINYSNGSNTSIINYTSLLNTGIDRIYSVYNAFAFISAELIMLFIIYFNYELQRNKKSRLLSVCYYGIIIPMIASDYCCEINSSLCMIFIRSSAIESITLISNYGFATIASSVASIVYSSFTYIMLFVLTKNKYIHPANYAIPVLYILLSILSQIINIEFTEIQSLLATLGLLAITDAYILIIVLLIRRKMKQDLLAAADIPGEETIAE